MQIKGMLFDFDGTLANTLPMCVKTFQYTLKQFLNRSFTQEEVIAQFGVAEEGILQRLIPDRWELALEHFLVTYQQLHEQCPKPFDGVESALQLLQQRGVALALVTGKGPRSAAFSLDYLGLSQYFDMVEVGAIDMIVKTRCITKILATWDMEPRYAAYVGDTDTDMREAKEAGVLPIGASWAETATIHQIDATTPFATFRDINDFIHWIDTNIEMNRV